MTVIRTECLFQTDLAATLRHNRHHCCRDTDQRQDEDNDGDDEHERLKFPKHRPLGLGNLLDQLRLNAGHIRTDLLLRTRQFILPRNDRDLRETQLTGAFLHALHIGQGDKDKILLVSARTDNARHAVIAHDRALAARNGNRITGVHTQLCRKLRTEQDLLLPCRRPVTANLPIRTDLL